jgi:hypothetical protein
MNVFIRYFMMNSIFGNLNKGCNIKAPYMGNTQSNTMYFHCNINMDKKIVCFNNFVKVAKIQSIFRLTIDVTKLTFDTYSCVIQKICQMDLW